MQFNDASKGLGIDTSRAIPVTKDDFVRFEAYTLDAATPVLLQLRQITIDGRLSVLSDVVNTTLSPFAPNAYEARLTDGWLLLAGFPPTRNLGANDYPYVRISLHRGRFSTAQGSIDLANGYLNQITGCSWPQTPITPMDSFTPTAITLAFPDPAAGADFISTAAATEADLPQLFTITLTTDATVALRRPQFALSSQATNLYTVNSPANVPATATVNYFLSRGPLPLNLVAGNVAIQLPDLDWSAQLQIQTLTANLQAGDQWSTARALTARRFTAFT